MKILGACDANFKHVTLSYLCDHIKLLEKY